MNQKKLKELRCGNYIKVKGDAGIYKAVIINSVLGEISIYGGVRDYEVFDIDKLTFYKFDESWFEVLGWKKRDHLWMKYWGRNGICFVHKKPDGNFYFECGKGLSVHVPYVHRLQNLFAEMSLYNEEPNYITH